MSDFAGAAVLFGLGAAVSWGVTDFFIAKSAKTLGSVKASLLVNGGEALMYGIIFLLFMQGSTFTGSGIAYAVIGSVFLGLAQATFFKAMKLGPVGLVSSISSTYPLIALAVGVALFGAVVSAVDIAGIVLIVGGVMIASGMFEKPGSLGKGPLVAMLPALCWGVGLGLISQALISMDWRSVLLIEFLVGPLMLLLTIPLIKGDEPVRFRALTKGVALPAVWAAAILQMTGVVSINIGLSEHSAQAAAIIAVSSCYPALTIFLALKHLKERIPLLPLLGGLTGIVGVIILTLG